MKTRRRYNKKPGREVPAFFDVHYIVGAAETLVKEAGTGTKSREKEHDGASALFIAMWVC